MKYSELEDDPIIQEWLSLASAKKTTRKSYIDSMRAYTDFLKKTPAQLIEETDKVDNTKAIAKKIFGELRLFKEHLEKSGLAPMSVKSRIAAVKSFYKYNFVELPTLSRSGTTATTLFENKKVPKKEDIQEVLTIANPLEKALVLIGCSSGLSSNEISNLTLQEFYDGYDPETEITSLHLIREKVQYEFHTFLSPETSRAILEYLKFRERKPKKNNGDRKIAALKRKINYDSNGKAIGYLFINRAIDPEYLETGNEEIRKLKPYTIQIIYTELCEKANKVSGKGKRNLIRSHNMRKFFNSTLLANGADIFTTDYMMGHKLSNTQDAYFRADPEKLKEKYKQFIPYLTIQKELNVAESPEYKKLKDENIILATETARNVVEREEIQRLNKKIEDLEKRKEADVITKEYLLSALQDPEIQEILRSSSK
ncbi:tyrosine-type recombinase/integrase [Methanosarcina mazei]|uniref:Integrase n=2 Tax=Methanosarcina mazei TaxID=2209 RepID=A0A0F8JW03_METMZ|nr:site-specific integrase [Methanosarcina mazei]AKB61762.1 hypothetical protein MSMAP_1777 [Methanosarcina mazei SarPi]KKG79813.1 hypothetical protein DU55_13145 [Methanosarcina mazei]